MEETAEAARTGDETAAASVPPPPARDARRASRRQIAHARPGGRGGESARPETRARPGEKPADVAPKPNEVDLASARLAAKAEAKAKAEAENCGEPRRTVNPPRRRRERRRRRSRKRRPRRNRPPPPRPRPRPRRRRSRSTPIASPGTGPGWSPRRPKEASVPSRDVSVPLSPRRDFRAQARFASSSSRRTSPGTSSGTDPSARRTTSTITTR